jgi:tetratricopeptide (TPR) repeat protein
MAGVGAQRSGESERPKSTSPQARDTLLARARGWAALGWLANENASEAEAYTASLALYRAAGDAWGTAFALRGLGARYWGAGDGERASAYLQESLALFQELGDAWGQALVLLNVGWVDHDADRLDPAGQAWQAALALFDRIGDRWGKAVALSNLGYLARLRLDDADAAAKNEAALYLFKEIGDKAGTATTLVRLGQVALRRTNLEQARQLFEQTLHLQQKLEPGWETMTALSELGLIAALHGDHERARALFAQGVALAETVNYYTPIADLHYNRAQAAYYAGDLEWAEAAWQQSAAQYADQLDPVGAALARAGTALVAWRRGRVDEAHRALTAVLDEVRADGDRRDLAYLVLALGQVTLALGESDAAGPLLEEARTLYRKLGDRHGLAQALEAEAALHLEWHAPNSAARLLGAAQVLRAALAAPVPAIDAPAHARLLERLRLELGETELAEALRAGDPDQLA